MVSGELVKAARNYRNLPWITPAVILALLPLTSLLVHADVDGRSTYLQLSYYWVFAFIIFFAAGRMRVVPWMHGFLAGVLVVFVYTQLAVKGWWKFPHTPSAAANYILYSQFLAMAIVLSSVLYKHTDQRGKKIIYLCGMGVFSVGVALGNGRTGLLTVVILLPYILLNIFKRRNILAVFAAGTAACLVLTMSPVVQNRLKDAAQDIVLFQENVMQTSLGYRFDMWETAWNVTLAHPFLGSGPSGFRDAWAGKAEEGVAKAFREPHNAFLFYASSFGVIGLAALLWLYMALLWTGWRRRHSLEGGVVFSFAVICILSSITNTVFLGAASLAWVMMFIGIQGGLAPSLSRTAPLWGRYSDGGRA